MVNEIELSMDARVLAAVWFKMGENASIIIGGEGSKSVLTERAETAMQELISKGFVVATAHNAFGKMNYIGTEKCSKLRLSQKDLRLYGKWSPVKSNPALENANV